MAEPKIGSIAERKARLAMESDTLRYKLQMQCDDLAPYSAVFMQGLQAVRLGASFIGATSSLRKGKHGGKLGIASLLLRLIKMR